MLKGASVPVNETDSKTWLIVSVTAHTVQTAPLTFSSLLLSLVSCSYLGGSGGPRRTGNESVGAGRDPGVSKQKHDSAENFPVLKKVKPEEFVKVLSGSSRSL